MNIKVGLDLPNKPLSNFEIEDEAKKIGLKNFRGVFLRDTLPARPRRNECAILNLDDTSGNVLCAGFVDVRILGQFRESTG